MASHSDSSLAQARPSSPLDALIGNSWPVLDAGFVRLIDYMGNDSAIVQAARVSYGAGTKSVREDQGLINYLMRHRHTTPFEMCRIKLHLKMPIFVARQWMRHRMASINEYSARYSIVDTGLYLPNALYGQSKNNGQGRDEFTMFDSTILAESCKQSYSTYGDLVEQGIAREMARMCLPQNTYTEFYWTIDLHNLLHFIQLRADSHAQAEIQAYANVLEEIVNLWVPLTSSAYNSYRRGAVTLSAPTFELILAHLNKEAFTIALNSSSISAGEKKEILAQIK